MARQKRSYNKKKRSYKRRSRSKYKLSKQVITPKNLIRSLRYTDTVQLNPGIGSQASYVFSANGIYDTDITGVGHQPTGFDQYMLMYDHYKVLGSKISVKFVPITGTGVADNQQIVSIKLQDTPSTYTDFRIGIENGQSCWSVIQSGNGSRTKNLTKTFSSKHTFPNRIASDSIVGSATANPSEQMFYVISSQALFGSHDPAAFNMLVVIDFIVSFTERKQLALS